MTYFACFTPYLIDTLIIIALTTTQKKQEYQLYSAREEVFVSTRNIVSHESDEYSIYILDFEMAFLLVYNHNKGSFCKTIYNGFTLIIYNFKL